MHALLAKPLVKYVGLPALVLLLVGAYTGATFYFGYDYSRKALQADLAEHYEDELADIRMRWVEDRVRVADLQERIREDVRKTRVITKEVPKYVTPDKDEFCGPPVGIVWLLNNARRPDVPLAAAGSDAAGQAPSGIGYTEQVGDTLEVTERYNELMLRHNALVKWIEDNYAPDERPGLRGSLE